jgi:hypothetical protein
MSDFWNTYLTFKQFKLIPGIRNSGKKTATDQKQWQISKNDLYKFHSQFTIESKNEIKLGRFLQY